MSSQSVFSHYQAAPVLRARGAAETAVTTSFDLGLTQVAAGVTAAGLLLPDDSTLPWDALEQIVSNENACYVAAEGAAEKIQFYSELTERAYSLYPTPSAPTMLVSGITMHRIVGTDPWRDTQAKIKAFGAKPTGRVLDTTMGLGYTAIQAAETADHVTTIELDPTVVEVCRVNPWSQPLFDEAKITRYVGHAWDVIEDEFEDGAFSFITHDPPMFNMAGELYSADFYRELHRVLRGRGKLFHYIGNPNSKSGATATRGVIRRLQEAGFRQVVARPQAFGVLALK